MEFFSDEALAIFVPILVYWAYSGMYMVLGHYLENYRLHSMKEEDSKNLVSKREVATLVLLQQLVQAAVASVMFMLTGDTNSTSTVAFDKEAQALSPYYYLTVARQFVVAMIVVDGWQYGWHRYMHYNRFLYKHIHSWHHRVVAPYAFATQYNHPLDGFLLDTISGALAFIISGMSPRTSIFFYSFWNIKGIDDHCGIMLPGNMFHLCFWNVNTAYHDVHHQLRGNRFNFSQPFFVTWDKVFGTHMPYVVEKRPGSGLQARPLIRKASHNGEKN